MGTTLTEHVPEPTAVTSRREIPELGVTVVKFANGVEAWFKPTDFKNDQVLFSLGASGGTSLAEPDKYPEAQLATSLVGLSGAGGHSAVELQKLLAGKIAGASPFFTLSTQGISGSSTPANLETGLQLLNLDFTAPGDDPDGFGLIKRQLEAAYANRGSNPNALFGEKLSAVNTMNHYTARPLTLDRIAKLDRAAMASFYRERPRTLRTSRLSWWVPSSSRRRSRSPRATSARCRRPAPPRADSRMSASRSRHPTRRPSSKRGASRKAPRS
jgi:zinc protease